MIHVIDAGPLIALLAGETGDAVVAQVLTDNPDECFAHVYNLAEV